MRVGAGVGQLIAARAVQGVGGALLVSGSLAIISLVSARLLLVVGPVIVVVGYGLFMIPNVGGSYWTTFFPSARDWPGWNCFQASTTKRGRRSGRQSNESFVFGFRLVMAAAAGMALTSALIASLMIEGDAKRRSELTRSYGYKGRQLPSTRSSRCTAIWNRTSSGKIVVTVAR